MTNLTVAFVVKLVNQTVAPMKALVADIAKVGKTSGDTAKPVANLGTSVQNAVAPANAAAQSAQHLATSLATVAPAAAMAGGAVAKSGKEMHGIAAPSVIAAKAVHHVTEVLAGLKATAKSVGDSVVGTGKKIGAGLSEAVKKVPVLSAALTGLKGVAVSTAGVIAGVGRKIGTGIADGANVAIAKLGQIKTSIVATVKAHEQSLKNWGGFAKNLAMNMLLDAHLVVSGFLAIKAAAVTAVAAGIGWVHGQAQAAEATLNAAKSAGVSAEAYQKLQYAYKSTGLGVDVLDGSLRTLDKNMIAARAGSKTQAETFRALGIRIKDATGHYKAADIVLGEVADRFAGMANGARKTALAQNLFGEAGAAMIPLLNKGSSGLKEMGDEAQKLGLILSKDILTASQKMNAVWDLTTSKLQGLGMTLFTGLLPPMTQLVETIADIIEQNRGDILKGLTGGLNWLKDHMPQILKGTKDFFKFLKDIVNISTAVTKAIGGINGVLDIFALAMIGKVAFSIGSAIVSVWGLNAALYGCPIVWIIAGITAVAVAAYLIIRHWDKVKKWLGDLWTWMKANLKWAPIIGPLIQLADMVSSHWSEVTSTFTTLADAVTDAFSKISNGWNILPEGVRKFLSGAALLAVPGGLALAPALVGGAKSDAGTPSNGVAGVVPKGQAGNRSAMTPLLTTLGNNQTQSFKHTIDLSLQSPVPVKVDRLQSTSDVEFNVGRQGSMWSQ